MYRCDFDCTLSIFHSFALHLCTHVAYLLCFVHPSLPPRCHQSLLVYPVDEDCAISTWRSYYTLMRGLILTLAIKPSLTQLSTT
jgi:hypothetical protein